MSESTLDPVIKGLLATRAASELCVPLGMLEIVARLAGWDDIAEDLASAHHHIHNAIRHATKGSDRINDAMADELEEIRSKWQDFIEETKETF